MFKWLFFTIATLVTLANAYTITYNYTGAEGGSCTASGVKDSVSVKCSAPSGFTWASASLKGEGSSIRYCVPDSCIADIKGDVTFNAEFAKSENVRKISWFETGYGLQDIVHGYARVTDMEQTKFLLAAAIGDSVKMTPVPVERYHWRRWYDHSGSKKTEIKTENSVYMFEMPDMNLLLEVEFDYNLYRVIADMNGGPEVFFERSCSCLADCYLWKDSSHWEGHIFQGWMLDKDAQDTFFIPFAMFTEPLSIADFDSVTMYAKWFEAKLPKKVNGCYQISNANELYGFAYLVSGKDGYEMDQSACGELTADIVVNKSVLTATDSLRKDTDHLLYWVPIGTSAKPFMGKFNGKGHTISGLYLKNSAGNDVGLFGKVQSAENKVVSIDSVGVIDSYIEGNEHVGGLVGAVVEKTNLSIKHSYTDMTIVGHEFGGLIGVGGDSLTISIDYSHHSGRMYPNASQRAYMGGLMGHVGRASSVFISNSFNDGIMDVSNKDWVIAGGFIGHSGNLGDYKPENALDTLIIGKSYNAAKITASKNDSYYSGGRQIAGFVGFLAANYGSISESYNSGEISAEIGEHCGDYAAGFVAGDYGKLNITRSYNEAMIKGEMASGLVGEGGTINIELSHNDGLIRGTCGASGMIGDIVQATIVNSYNVGDVGEIKDRYGQYTEIVPGSGFGPTTDRADITNSYTTSDLALNSCQLTSSTMKNVFYIEMMPCKEENTKKNTAEEFADGSIAWALYNYSAEGVDGHVWGQKVGTDPYPLLNGAGVEGYDGGRTSVAFKPSVNSFTIATQGRKVQITGAAVGARFHVFDIQGRNIPVAGFASSRINTPDFEISLPNKGRYLIAIGGITRAVTIK
ncbi:MAG: hypothetical protein J6T54_11815 [Fibrobacter sp.]|nr:hypothetical protein [Fibrobacter sp.]